MSKTYRKVRLRKKTGYATEKEINSAVERITLYERYFDEISERFYADKQSFMNDKMLSEKLSALTDYYENGQWLKDRELDNEGRIPNDLKRGILSEDAVFDLICDIDRGRKTDNR